MLRYKKLPDLRRLTPVDAIVFLDDHEDTTHGGRFVGPSYNKPDTWGGFPGSRHNGLGAVSYADGHVGPKKWSDPRTRVQVRRALYEANDNWTNCQPNNADITWFLRHTTIPLHHAPWS